MFLTWKSHSFLWPIGTVSSSPEYWTWRIRIFFSLVRPSQLYVLWVPTWLYNRDSNVFFFMIPPSLFLRVDQLLLIYCSFTVVLWIRPLLIINALWDQYCWDTLESSFREYDYGFKHQSVPNKFSNLKQSLPYLEELYPTFRYVTVAFRRIRSPSLSRRERQAFPSITFRLEGIYCVEVTRLL